MVDTAAMKSSAGVTTTGARAGVPLHARRRRGHAPGGAGPPAPHTPRPPAQRSRYSRGVSLRISLRMRWRLGNWAWALQGRGTKRGTGGQQRAPPCAGGKGRGCPRRRGALRQRVAMMVPRQNPANKGARERGSAGVRWGCVTHATKGAGCSRPAARHRTPHPSRQTRSASARHRARMVLNAMLAAGWELLPCHTLLHGALGAWRVLNCQRTGPKEAFLSRVPPPRAHLAHSQALFVGCVDPPRRLGAATPYNCSAAAPCGARSCLPARRRPPAAGALAPPPCASTRPTPGACSRVFLYIE